MNRRTLLTTLSALLPASLVRRSAAAPPVPDPFLARVWRDYAGERADRLAALAELFS